jgi:predicted nuclease of restriction endonuclease-like (RecB) superfamily
MNRDFAGDIADRASLMGNWQGLLRDKEALLNKPGTHHKTLLRQAHQLHQEQVIDDGELCDFLELADAALAFAIESLHDIKTDE